MKEIKRLLVAFDGTEDSVNALNTAANLSKQLNAAITVAHVFDESAAAITADSSRYPANTTYMTDGLQNYPVPPSAVDQGSMGAEENQDYIGGRTTEVSVQASNILEENNCSGEVKVLDGDPAEAITVYAEEIQADMIIMGSRHLSGLKKLFSGSVSEKVSSSTNLPVLIV
ncbi:universal stress protein [Metabacillus sp. RGM 3146]|uniref:universal stress protein n=1 Tax=Metabacillus sp. RGM 3146 TaxID=3401092 RepID=UPI003B99D259